MVEAVPANHRPLGYGLAALVFVVDQISKYLVMGPLALPERGLIDLTSFFDLRWVENYGVSMGFLIAASDKERWLLVLITALIAAGVCWWIWREKNRFDVIALGLVLGGEAGNITDRARFGYVADFLDFHLGEWRPFLVFNVADAAITIGVLVLVARAFLVREPKAPAENVDAV
jgi:signal peptidase II